MATCLADGTRVSSRDRQCDCCLKPIPRGERYFYASIKSDDGDVYTWHSHTQEGHCGAHIEDYGDSTWCEICENR